MFDRKRILALFWPVLLEQTAATLVGIISTMMVSGVSEAAVAGVGMVGAVNLLVMNAFTAVSTGVTVVVAQCIGSARYKDASASAAQSLVVVTYISLGLTALMLAFDWAILGFLFGGAEEDVLQAARTYFFFSSVTLPPLALFSTEAGILRASGDTKSPMLGSLISNGSLFLVAFPCIHWLGLGVTGAGLGLAASRVAPCVFLSLLLRRGRGGLLLPRLSPKLDGKLLWPVLRVALPAGVDATLFNGGKLIVQIFMAGMGTAVLAANSILNSLSALFVLPGSAIQILIITIVGQSFGAGQHKKARRETFAYMLAACVACLIPCLICIPLISPLYGLFGATAETAAAGFAPTLLYLVTAPLLWAPAFVLPSALRAADSVTYTMWTSIVSMFLLRVAGSWFFGVWLDWGLYGIWFSMVLDWAGRAVFFIPRAGCLLRRNPEG